MPTCWNYDECLNEHTAVEALSRHMCHFGSKEIEERSFAL